MAETSPQVRADDLLAPLDELENRDFLESLSPKARAYLGKFKQDFSDNTLYFRRTLVLDTTAYMKSALEELENEFSDLVMTANVKFVFNNYNQLLLLFKAERQRLVDAFKDFIEIAIEEKQELQSKIEELHEKLTDSETRLEKLTELKTTKEEHNERKGKPA